MARLGVRRRVRGQRAFRLVRAILEAIQACVRAWHASARTRAHEAEAAVSAALADFARRGERPTVREVAAAAGLDTDQAFEVLWAGIRAGRLRPGRDAVDR